MNRQKFIHQCGAACITGTLFGLLLESCGTQKAIPVTDRENCLLVPVTALYTEKDGEKKYKRFVIIRHARVAYPIALFRNNQNRYEALLLQCTHQGNELTVHGDLISCHAHGSEFGPNGEVLQGPAEKPLKKFPIIADSEFLFIQIA